MLACGCAGRTGGSADAVLLVPGVAGDGGRFNGLVRELRQTHGGQIQLVSWGAPWPLFFVNFSTRSIHDRAETKLARHIEQLRQANPSSQIDLVGHSAGCGVILGALGRLNDPVHVRQVILLAPSVSPQYNLEPGLRRVDGMLHAFYSDRDTLFLSWRTGNFGTYDRVKTRAAGNCGFDLGNLPSELRGKIVQHAYDPNWKSLRHDGGHFGALAEPFVRCHVTPLLHTSQSSEASSR